MKMIQNEVLFFLSKRAMLIFYGLKKNNLKHSIIYHTVEFSKYSPEL